MPVMIIRGENTFEMARVIVEELERVLPNAELVIIPNAGHGSPREDPKAFTDAVSRFLDKVKRP
jgi:pimeloyl-ACP methyl ester carboxylesterase